MTELMTCDEMLARLKAGEDPFDLSIEKWERIKYILDHSLSVSLYDCKSNTCALCEVHIDDAVLWCWGNHDFGILPCPLESCSSGSVWHCFAIDMTSENAQRMIDAIKKARCPEANEGS